MERSLGHIKAEFLDIEVISLSGNYCMDKKPSAINWIEGCGKYVVCDAVVPSPSCRKGIFITIHPVHVKHAVITCVLFFHKGFED